jgi:hypothetical protein
LKFLAFFEAFELRVGPWVGVIVALVGDAMEAFE